MHIQEANISLTQLAEAVIRRMSSTNGISVPPGLQKGKPLFFAIDNIDFQEDTPDGKDTLHGTMMVVFQKTDEACLAENDGLSLCPPANRSLKILPSSIVNLAACDISGNIKAKRSPKYPFRLGQIEQVLHKSERQCSMDAG